MCRLYNKLSVVLLLLSLCGSKGILAAQGLDSDIFTDAGVDYYTNLTLPSLDILFENARTAPAYELADVRMKVENQLLAREKKSFLRWFSIRGSWQYGNFVNDASYSDIVTPVFNTYTKAAQTSYTVGAGVSIPIEDLFDLAPRIKRQRMQVRVAELQKEMQYQSLKQEIIDLYLSASSQLAVVKLRAEAVVLANTQYAIVEKNFANGMADSGVLSMEKEKQTMAMERYENIISQLARSVLMLEIITGTPIITK